MKARKNVRVQPPVPGERELSELVMAVRAGDQDAISELRQLFYPGTQFLVQRRLGSGNVEPQVAEILDSVLRTIQADGTVTGVNLASMVRQSIAEHCPVKVESSANRAVADNSAVAQAKGVWDGLSPVELDALRRCYVLREPPESFLEALRLTPDQFRAIRSKARTEFNARHSRQINVA